MSDSEQEKRVAALIGQVYDAALDERLWAGLAPQIAQAFNSFSTVLQVRNMRAGAVEILALTANNDIPSVMDEYRAYYWRHDIWANRATALGLSRVFASKDLISDETLLRTEYYQDWLRKLGVFYIVGSVFPVSADEIAAWGVHRARAQGTYEEDEKQPVAEFLPHLQRALQIRQRLASLTLERNVALDGLERSATATLVVTRNGRVLYANTQAESLLRQADALSVIGGRLAGRDRTASERLTRAIESAVDIAGGRAGSAGSTIALSRDDRLPLTVLVAPLRPARDGFGTPLPAAILFIRDPEETTVSSLALQSLFGLTPAEANIAGALVTGKSIDDIAALNRISRNTARTHLKSILAKTGTNRQAQLVGLLLRSVAAMGSQ